MESSAAFITILSPFLAALSLSLFGPLWGERVVRFGIGALTVSTVGALVCLYKTMVGDDILVRFNVFPEPFAPTLLVDRLAAVMMVLIAVVSLLIHMFSRRYMQGDEGYVRFFTLLSFLSFVLLNLVTSGNLLWLLVWWHVVTWLLRELIAFNRASDAARRAGRMTLVVQGIGDAALLGAVVLVFIIFGTLDVPELSKILGEGGPIPVLGEGLWWEMSAMTAITMILLLTIMTKSAQFPFHIWLPGTIEAPTPVSAMLHAGIVNAGGFLINRLAPLFGFAPATLHLLFIIGALTVLIGAATMLTQSSVKRTLAYSTMGQMGYMVMECGLGAFALAIFHLCAHGLFKATLFLNSGAGIHRARTDWQLPGRHAVREPSEFSLATWGTGLAVTLILPLVILLVAHDLVDVPLLDAQGAVIFLFFAWVTSAQAVFSLYRLQTVPSWKIPVTMLATLALIGLTYLWAAESFTHYLYPGPGEALRYLQAGGWPQGLFEGFVAISALLVVGVWVILYGEAHGMQMWVPRWVQSVRTRLYVAFLNGLYVEDLLGYVRAVRVRRWHRFPKSS